MKRMLGFCWIIFFCLGFGTHSHAQTMAVGDWYSQGAGFPGVPGIEAQASLGNGGFGADYTQGPPASGVYMNRWGQVIGVAEPATSPIATEPRPAQAAPVNSRRSRGAFRGRFAVTTGSIGGPAGSEIRVNPMPDRHTSYGSGYALSPYGTVNYYGGFRGYTLGN